MISMLRFGADDNIVTPRKVALLKANKLKSSRQKAELKDYAKANGQDTKHLPGWNGSATKDEYIATKTAKYQKKANEDPKFLDKKWGKIAGIKLPGM